VSRVFNLLALQLSSPRDPAPDGHSFTMRSLSGEVGAHLTGCSVYEVGPGQATWPYHFELNEEEWLIVVQGELTLRTPDGERVLRTGDVVCFPAGVTGAHAVRNDGELVARFAMPSSVSPFGDACVYPDSGTFKLSGPGFSHRGRLGDEVRYWEGEA